LGLERGDGDDAFEQMRQPAPSAEPTRRSAPVAERDLAAHWLAQLRELVQRLAERASVSDTDGVVQLQQELREWAVEVRAAGVLGELAKAVDTAVKRLTSALTRPAKLSAKATEIADVLRALMR
jgi:hypothetical protein